MTYIDDQAVIRQAWLTNFLLNRVMLQGGNLDEAVDVLFLVAGDGEDNEFEASQRLNEAAILAGKILETRAAGEPLAVVFGRARRKVRTELEIGDVQQGDILDGRTVVGTGHTARDGWYRTQLMFETPGVRAEDAPRDEWTHWIDSDKKVVVYR